MLAKTSRPRLSAVYQRSRLFDLLDRLRRQHSATFISAPPGAGKTALISSYVEFLNLRCLWYQIDSGDEDVATLFHYLSRAAKVHLGANVGPLPEFDSGSASDLTRFSRHYFREFYSALAAPMILVLDNYHELARDSPAQIVIRTACEEVPQNHHVIMMSREACPVPLTRLCFSHGLTTVDGSELVLTPDEALGIAALHGLKVDSADAAVGLQTSSAGWALGLVLMVARIGAGSSVADLSHPASEEQQEPIFDYFLSEVFAALECECRDLLVVSALLPRMTVQRVAQLTGTPKAGALLRELMRKNQFVTRLAGPESAYEFHPLFREFLLRQCSARYLAADLRSKCQAAAEVLLQDGDDEAAIELLERAHDWPRMAEVILTSAPTLKLQGRDATIELRLQKLPSDLIRSSPWLLYWLGSSKVVAAPAYAQEILRQAYDGFIELSDVTGMALSWCGLVDAICKDHKDLRQLDGLVAEFEDRFSQQLEQLAPSLSARVTVCLFNALSLREPQHPKMQGLLEQVRRLLESEPKAGERALLRHHIVIHHILRGEHAQAESVLSMLHYADHLPAEERPLRSVIDHVSEAVVAMHMGMQQRCLRAVSQGVIAAAGTGNQACESVLLQLGAVMSLNRGDITRADEFLGAFERLAETAPSLDCGAYYAVAGWRKFQAGEPPLAVQLLQRAVATTEARGSPYYTAVDNLGLGLLLHLCGSTKEALEHFEVARKLGAGIKNPLINFAYHLFSAHVALNLEARERARVHLVSGMQIGRQNGYMHFFFFPPRVIARLCLAALDYGIETEYVRALIDRNELTPDPAWRQAESWPWPLRIYTLGRFGLVKNGTAVRFAGKAQKKPLELLKALIAFGGRDVPEGRLVDALWPEAEGDAAAQNLTTNLFRLRKLVGEQAIRRQESRLTLDPTVVWVDCWAFERLSSDDTPAPSQRRAKLAKLHQGPFLDGADDAPWAEPMRKRLQAKLARSLGASTQL